MDRQDSQMYGKRQKSRLVLIRVNHFGTFAQQAWFLPGSSVAVR